MTDEKILELASQYLEVLITEDNGNGEFPTDFAATSEQLLKFSRAIWAEGFKAGVEYDYDEGWESSKVSTKMNTWNSDDE